MSRHRTGLARLAAAGLGVGALAFGPGAGAASAGTPAGTDRALVRWANPRMAAIVHRSPSGRSGGVGRLHFLTEEGQAEVYVTSRVRYVRRTGTTWIEVSLPQRPNGATGWVVAQALGRLHLVRGRLVVRRARLRATLYDRAGHAVWSAPVGIGSPTLPTPAGHFYVREKLRTLGSPMYGPFALGTSAYAPSLTDWPGGGVVGIHGTDEPELIPGRPSHGCIRLRNRDVTRLWHRISVGTLVDVV